MYQSAELLAQHYANSGFWFCAEELRSELWKSIPHITLASAPNHRHVQGMGAKHFPSTKSFASDLPTHMHPELVAVYNRQLEYKIRDGVIDALENLVEMLQAVTGNNRDVARLRAEMMTSEDLLAWLHDPRIWYEDWWRENAEVMAGLPDRVPLLGRWSTTTATTMAATATVAPASIAEDSADSTGTKRKRSSEDEGETERMASSKESPEMSKQGSPKAPKLAEPVEGITPRSITLSPGPPTPEDSSGGEPEASEPPSKRKPEYPIWSGTTVAPAVQTLVDDPFGIKQLPWPIPDPVFPVTHFEGYRPLASPLRAIPENKNSVRRLALNILESVWREVTAELHRCPCSICRRAEEREEAERRAAAQAAKEKASVARMFTPAAVGRTYQQQYLGKQVLHMIGNVSKEDDEEGEEEEEEEEEVLEDLRNFVVVRRKFNFGRTGSDDELTEDDTDRHAPSDPRDEGSITPIEEIDEETTTDAVNGHLANFDDLLPARGRERYDRAPSPSPPAMTPSPPQQRGPLPPPVDLGLDGAGDAYYAAADEEGEVLDVIMVNPREMMPPPAPRRRTTAAWRGAY